MVHLSSLQEADCSDVPGSRTRCMAATGQGVCPKSFQDTAKYSSSSSIPHVSQQQLVTGCHLLRSSYAHVIYLLIVNTPQWCYKCLNACILHGRTTCRQNAFLHKHSFISPWSPYSRLSMILGVPGETWKFLCSTKQQIQGLPWWKLSFYPWESSAMFQETVSSLLGG